MIQPNARGAWQELEGQLRPFVARRLGDASDVDDVLQDIYLRIQAGVRNASRLRAVRALGVPGRAERARRPRAARARHPLPATGTRRRPWLPPRTPTRMRRSRASRRISQSS